MTPEHPLAMVVATATHVQVLPDVVDASSILTCAGLGGLITTMYGVLRRHDPDHLAQMTLKGTVAGGCIGGTLFLAALIIGVR